jgi:hypothetical protein
MSIIKTITWDYEFANWLKKSDNYSNNFTFTGANALQAYLDELSDDTGENIEFDPIAWCVEYTEYKSALEAYNQQHGEDEFIKVDEDNTEENANAQALEWLQDNTSVVELDNGGVIIADF